MNTNQILQQIDTQPDNSKEFSATFRLPSCDTDTTITSDCKQRLKDMVTMLLRHRADAVFSHEQDDLQHERRGAR